MGTGISSSYSGTYGASQRYAPSYEVVPEMKKKDVVDPHVYVKNRGYFKNPKSGPIESLIRDDKIVLDGEVVNGPFLYVLDVNGRLIIGKRHNPFHEESRSPHPTLLGGKNPKVLCAGMITFSNGRIYKYNHKSGHYRPNPGSLRKVDEYLVELHKEYPNIFDDNYKRNKYAVRK